MVPNNFFLEGQIRAIWFMITIIEATVFVTSCSLTCSGCVCSNEIFCVVPLLDLAVIWVLVTMIWLSLPRLNFFVLRLCEG